MIIRLNCQLFACHKDFFQKKNRPLKMFPSKFPFSGMVWFSRNCRKVANNFPFDFLLH